uniref:Uncharacterized protein n=1 Tax=Anopheles atroparvus TaxID=41427 RepID=A0A182JH83_ANOAO
MESTGTQEKRALDQMVDTGCEVRTGENVYNPGRTGGLVGHTHMMLVSGGISGTLSSCCLTHRTVRCWQAHFCGHPSPSTAVAMTTSVAAIVAISNSVLLPALISITERRARNARPLSCSIHRKEVIGNRRAAEVLGGVKERAGVAFLSGVEG